MLSTLVQVCPCKLLSTLSHLHLPGINNCTFWQTGNLCLQSAQPQEACRLSAVRRWGPPQARCSCRRPPLRRCRSPRATPGNSMGPYLCAMTSTERPAVRMALSSASCTAASLSASSALVAWTMSSKSSRVSALCSNWAVRKATSCSSFQGPENTSCPFICRRQLCLEISVKARQRASRKAQGVKVAGARR